MSETENHKVSESDPQKNLEVTVKSKKPRSQKTIEWSKQLGQRSSEFKRKKQELINSRLKVEPKPERQTKSEEETEQITSGVSQSEEVNISQSEEVGVTPSEEGNFFNSKNITFGVIIGVLGVCCLGWCKWGKHKVFGNLFNTNKVEPFNANKVEPFNANKVGSFNANKVETVEPKLQPSNNLVHMD